MITLMQLEAALQGELLRYLDLLIIENLEYKKHCGGRQLQQFTNECDALRYPYSNTG
jgi:hypothetical protein